MRIASLMFLVTALISVSMTAGADTPEYVLDVSYNSDVRTIEGSLDLHFVPESTTAYFSLLANLNAEPNPYVSPRHEDAAYPYGFEPARITVLSVVLVTDAGEEPLSFRLLALPPSWQTYSLIETVLAVDLPSEAAGSALSLRCHFITEVPRTTTGDQGVTDDILTWRFGWFPLLLPEQAHIEEHDGTIAYAGRGSFPLVFPWSQLTATVTVPAALQLIVGADSVELANSSELVDVTERANSAELASSGELVDASASADAAASAAAHGSVITYLVRNASPSRSLALTLGSTYESYRIESSSRVTVFYLPHHEATARFIATLALDILADYVARYGPYPRASLTIVENPSPHGQAFAADGIVWLSSRFFTHRDVLLPGALDRIIEYVLAHEIAHQWVGLGTGIDLDAEAWLSEGLAQYLSVRYFEARYGSFGANLFVPQIPGLAGEFVEQQWGFLNLREHFVELPYLLTTRAGFDEALVKPTEYVQYGNAATVRLYDKGYLVARAIGAKIGWEAFERAITRAIAERRADLLDVRTFQALLEEESGQSLSAFFEYWVFGEESADYAVRILRRSVENGVHTTVVSVTRDGGVPQPVIVEATMQSNGTVRQSWDGVESSAVLEFTTPTRVARASIDPDHYLPDRDRLNNHAPVKIVGAVSQNVLPLDAYVLAPDQSSNGVIFSHLDRLRVSVSSTSASASVKLDRNRRIDIQASFASAEPTGQIAYTYTTYGQPETGSAATVWEPAAAFTLAGERYASSGDPFLALRLRVTKLPSIAGAGTHSAMVRVTSQGVTQAELSARNELRLFPGGYLLARARVGLSYGEVPPPLLFRLSELQGFRLPGSSHAAVVKVALELPTSGKLPYSLLHVVMIDEVLQRLFLTAGAGWTSLDEFGTTSPSIEVGIEQSFGLSTLGGLVSMTARVGISTPVLGAGITVLYGSISF